MTVKSSEVFTVDSYKSQEPPAGTKILNNETVRYIGDVGLVYTVDDAVNKVGYGKFQIILTCLAGLGWLADAFEIIILSIIGDFVACEWPLRRWMNAVLTSSVFLGMMIGSPLFGMIADVFGRKRSLAISMTLLFSFGALSAASPSYIWMVLFRCCMGIALGGVAQGLTLCSEYFPANVRGKGGFYLCYFWSVGTIGVILLAWLIMEYLDSWRVLLVAASVPALMVILSLWWYPESARYYLVSNQYERAQSLLEQMAAMNGKDLPPGKLLQITQCSRRGRMIDLLRGDLIRKTLLYWFIWFAVAFAYYGVALVTPIIIQRGSLLVADNHANSTVEGSFFDDMQEYVKCTHFTQRNYIDLLWTSAAEFPGLIIFTFLVEYCNRKYLLSSSCAITGILIFLLLMKTHYLVILICLFGARAISVAVFQLIFIMTSESFPTTLRASAMGSGSAMCRIGGLVVPYVSQGLTIQNPVLAICVLGGVIMLGAVAAALLPDTRGKDMQESHSANG